MRRPMEIESDDEAWFVARDRRQEGALLTGVVVRYVATGKDLLTEERFDLSGGPNVFLKKVKDKVAEKTNIPRASIKLLRPKDAEGTNVVAPIILRKAWKHRLEALTDTVAARRRERTTCCEICMSSCSDADEPGARTTREE